MKFQKDRVKVMDIEDISRATWKVLFFFSLLGVIWMWFNTYTQPIEHRQETWHEKLFLPLYYTFQTNFSTLLLSSLIVFKKPKYNQKWLIAFKNYVFISLVVTLTVYWLLIFPTSNHKNVPIFINNFIVHLIVPVLGFVAYFVDIKINRHKNYNLLFWKQNPYIFALKYLIYPFIWLLISIIVYYSLGANKENAIYSFLAINQNAWWITSIYILIILLFFYWLSFFTIRYSNPNNYVQLQKKKRLKIRL